MPVRRRVESMTDVEEGEEPDVTSGSKSDPRKPPRPPGLNKCQIGSIVVACIALVLVLVLPLGFGSEQYKTQQVGHCVCMCVYVCTKTATRLIKPP